MRILKKPEYFYRPKQIVRRLMTFVGPKDRQEFIVKVLGQPLKVSINETIGKSLVHFGLYDLALTETIWRLTETGDSVADIGANLGYFSLVFAHRVGAYGRVHCFEPHPLLQKKWQNHLRKWSQCKLYPIALSSSPGEMDLSIPKDFSNNEGIASLERIAGAEVIRVQVNTLDQALNGQTVDIIKIDVEGHEMEVFKGASQTLRSVKYILFEDFKNENSPAVQYFRESGFKVFRIYKGFSKVLLMEVEEAQHLPLWEPPNYIACRDENVLKAKLSASGWKCLKFL